SDVNSHLPPLVRGHFAGDLVRCAGLKAQVLHDVLLDSQPGPRYPPRLPEFEVSVPLRGIDRD
ncbi:MAG: hypothetical protein ACRCU2_17480, partial [Planktothrix sp.]